MTKDEFKRYMKRDVHQGTGQTRKRDKQADSAEIERLTEQFLKSGGKIQELESEQRRPYRSPAFNPGDIGGEV
jgi:hypothetical protein